MTDVVDTATRSRMMAGIRGGNTKPEMQVRRYLHACGFRFRLHRRDLPGRPDLVLPRHRLAIFVHGCFWHRHPGCHYASTPATRRLFWRDKFARNVARDKRNIDELGKQGWRVFVLWECGLRHSPECLIALPDWITGNASFVEWPYQPPKPKKQQLSQSSMIKKGDTIEILPQFRDPGDEEYTWVALTGVEKDDWTCNPWITQ